MSKEHMKNNIKVHNLCKSFPRPNGKEIFILDHLNIEFQANEITCIMGTSGCGKSTLINIIAGFEQPSSGYVMIGDEQIKGPTAKVDILFQENVLFPWKTVAGNLKFALRMKEYSKSETKQRVKEYLESIGMEDIEDCYPKDLSGGMQQRVALLRTLIAKPKVVILDESFGALDVLTRYNMQRFFLDLHAKFKFTALVITHDIKEAAILGDRIIILNHVNKATYTEIQNIEKSRRDKNYGIQHKLEDCLRNGKTI